MLVWKLAEYIFLLLFWKGHCPLLPPLHLHPTPPHSTPLHSTPLIGTALHCTALHCTALHCTALHCTALHCTALHCTALHCTALHCTALHCTALHCTSSALHFAPPPLPSAPLRHSTALHPLPSVYVGQLCRATPRSSSKAGLLRSQPFLEIFCEVLKGIHPRASRHQLGLDIVSQTVTILSGCTPMKKLSSP